MERIFISYKRVDKDKVFRIKDQIESTIGEKCWIDIDGIESDAQFANVIIQKKGYRYRSRKLYKVLFDLTSFVL